MAPSPPTTVRRALDWLFRDRNTGAMTVAQWPNLPLWLFAGFSLAAWTAQEQGPLASWLSLGADLALAWWAADELLRGVNPWRRFLGGATILGLAALFALRHAA
ncbi:MULTISPECIES: hypothetical protein [unclassified Methylobacterium]|jgi:hypothetical protein|uniref:hypothetical protein n=1 Tax=unclassified Methylobacterium TaxID=2615210 RepID=UPI0005BBF8D4|nr:MULTISPECIES: hypothetical protein [unclassified Methylobacterium]SFU44034.1 hypothetical protein SAMN02799643_00695 [Methylobacterium sp. UNCCL125]